MSKEEIMRELAGNEELRVLMKTAQECPPEIVEAARMVLIEKNGGKYDGR